MILCLLILPVLTGCAAGQLTAFKTHAAKGEYGWIAGQAVSCEKVSNRCSQLHLIKGEACLHVAKDESASIDDYICATDEIEKGIALKPSWDDTALHHKYHEMLCYPLMRLHDLQSDKAAKQILPRLDKAAKSLNRLAPQSVPAVYYLASTRLRQVHPYR